MSQPRRLNLLEVIAPYPPPATMFDPRKPLSADPSGDRLRRDTEELGYLTRGEPLMFVIRPVINAFVLARSLLEHLASSLPAPGELLDAISVERCAAPASAAELSLVDELRDVRNMATENLGSLRVGDPAGHIAEGAQLGSGRNSDEGASTQPGMTRR